MCRFLRDLDPVVYEDLYSEFEVYFEEMIEKL